MVHKRAHEGYLLIDNRESPGVGQDFVDACDLGAITVPGKSLFESATVTCCHCNAVVVLNPQRTRPRGYCARCDAYVCDNPACGLECRPFAKVIDDILNGATQP